MHIVSHFLHIRCVTFVGKICPVLQSVWSEHLDEFYRTAPLAVAQQDITGLYLCACSTVIFGLSYGGRFSLSKPNNKQISEMEMFTEANIAVML